MLMSINRGLSQQIITVIMFNGKNNNSTLVIRVVASNSSHILNLTWVYYNYKTVKCSYTVLYANKSSVYSGTELICILIITCVEHMQLRVTFRAFMLSSPEWMSVLTLTYQSHSSCAVWINANVLIPHHVRTARS